MSGRHARILRTTENRLRQFQSPWTVNGSTPPIDSGGSSLAVLNTETVNSPSVDRARTRPAVYAPTPHRMGGKDPETKSIRTLYRSGVANRNCGGRNHNDPPKR